MNLTTMGNEELVEEIKLQYIKFALHENNEDAAICALLRTELLRRLSEGERAVAAMENAIVEKIGRAGNDHRKDGR